MSRARGRPKGGYVPDTERKPALQRIKERHRLLAKFVASGLTRNEIAARLDMTPERVGQLMLDPAMQNLVRQFEDHPQVREISGLDDLSMLRSISTQNALRAALAMQDTLNYYEEADEKVPVRESAKIFELSSDRIGFGKRTTNLNVNVDFAAQLDRAIDRSRGARTISAKATTLPAPGGADTLAPSAPPTIQSGSKPLTSENSRALSLGGGQGPELGGTVPAPMGVRVVQGSTCERSEVRVESVREVDRRF